VQAPVDVLVLEGWCLGAEPEKPGTLQTPVNALEAEEDAAGQWRRYANDALAGQYAALWRHLHGLIFLEVPDLRAVLRWRTEQEQALPDRPAPDPAAPVDADRSEEEEALAPQDEARTELDPASEAVPTPDPPLPPQIDTFRLDPDGQMLVAGRSAPGWETSILVDENTLARLTADDSGQFVHFSELQGSAAPRVLSLTMRSSETGEEIPSRDLIIIAPTLSTSEGAVAPTTTHAQEDGGPRESLPADGQAEDARPAGDALSGAATPAHATNGSDDTRDRWRGFGDSRAFAR